MGINTRPFRLITTLGAPPNFNMGLDEALLEIGESPTLRIYSWAPDTLSLGYFQKLSDIPERDKASRIVRRITGGGAIHHTGELTFSITTDASDPIYHGNITHSYERVHHAIMRALAQFQVPADLRRDSQALSDTAGTGMCFHHSTPLDIMWNGRKGVGSAQRRRNSRVLHHGSIKLNTSDLETQIASTSAEGPCTEPAHLIPHLLNAFAQELGMDLSPGAPTTQERELASSLEPKYSSEPFLNRR